VSFASHGYLSFGHRAEPQYRKAAVPEQPNTRYFEDWHLDGKLGVEVLEQEIQDAGTCGR
jgi:hypothetical protein